MKHLQMITLSSTGLSYLDGDCNFSVTDSLDILRVTGLIMLYSEKDKCYMGDFEVQNLISHSHYSSYWLKLPEEIWSDLEFLRKKNYDSVSTNSQIAFILKAQSVSRTENKKITYSIDLLNNITR